MLKQPKMLLSIESSDTVERCVKFIFNIIRLSISQLLEVSGEPSLLEYPKLRRYSWI